MLEDKNLKQNIYSNALKKGKKTAKISTLGLN